MFKFLQFSCYDAESSLGINLILMPIFDFQLSLFYTSDGLLMHFKHDFMSFTCTTFRILLDLLISSLISDPLVTGSVLAFPYFVCCW